MLQPPLSPPSPLKKRYIHWNFKSLSHTKKLLTRKKKEIPHVHFVLYNAMQIGVTFIAANLLIEVYTSVRKKTLKRNIRSWRHWCKIVILQSHFWHELEHFSVNLWSWILNHWLARSYIRFRRASVLYVIKTIKKKIWTIS